MNEGYLAQFAQSHYSRSQWDIGFNHGGFWLVGLIVDYDFVCVDVAAPFHTFLILTFTVRSVGT